MASEALHLVHKNNTVQVFILYIIHGFVKSNVYNTNKELKINYLNTGYHHKSPRTKHLPKTKLEMHNVTNTAASSHCQSLSTFSLELPLSNSSSVARKYTYYSIPYTTIMFGLLEKRLIFCNISCFLIELITFGSY